MKLIRVNVSENAETALAYMNSRIPHATRETSEYKSISIQIASCIEDFAARATKLANSGTTIHIERKFTLPGVVICVILKYPKKVNILERAISILKKRK